MAALGTIIGWIGRKGLLFLLLVAAMLAYAIWSSGDLRRVALEAPVFHREQAERLDEAASTLEQARDEAEARLRSAGQDAQRASIDALERELASTRSRRLALIEAQRRAPSTLLSAVRLDVDAIVESRRLGLELAFVDRKIEGLQIALESARSPDSQSRLAIGRQLQSAGQREAGALRAWQQAQAQCRSARQALVEFQSRDWPRRQVQRLLGERNRRVRAYETRCAEAEARRNSLIEIRQRRVWLQRQSEALGERTQQARAWVDEDLPLEIGDLRERAEQERQRASRSILARAERFWDRYRVGDVLRWAAWALAIIILSPFLIRTLCYFLLAPAAMRRPPIRLQAPGGRGPAIPPSLPSAPSVAVRLSAGEELLVRQDYLQSSAVADDKDTLWLLDWRAPFISLASGLVFLTRIRGEGEVTTLAPTRNPFAEIAILTLPEGAACAIAPRSLAGVVHPIRRPLRVTTHWRLGTLNAWLTMQLRHVVFHGPARLIVKGGRGVRVDRARRGRIFDQDQLVGFSADLQYSVARTETFWPYFLGRASLLKVMVDQGDGLLVIEETPMAGRRGGPVRRGIEGMIDAGMKAFGI